MKFNKNVKILIVIFIIISIAIGLSGFLIAYIPSRMSEKHTNDIVNLYFQDTGYDINSFNSRWEELVREFEIVSDLGHIIPVYYITQDNNYDNKTIILVHWHESNHIAMYPIAELFLENGWNVVLYDQRAHGKNTANTVTFGYLESQDLAQVIDFTRINNNDNVVGVLGQSMGASTIAYYLGDDEAKGNLSFAIIDSPYSDMYNEVLWEISKGKDTVIANGLSSLGSAFCKAIYGYSFKDVNIVERVKNSNTPTLLLHSRTDQKCPYYMAEDIFKAIPHEQKEFITYENSDHLFSFWDEPEIYAEGLFAYIENFSDSTK